ncbi:Uncharacterized protein BP5553_09270 [Venustampulla echinocandica]|uniref:Uncharacterized protein n=1 Tax=Venustampulla echinocandica TaxID=2656787 RepID=A0A370TC90_9HELO|nr:Uncharacterized protein BP5553_09270 [Venustampulla echinocandica]RDL31868.1 Uncharacterized protein BP5553_09270 [Venustampulla echinocandica]
MTTPTLIGMPEPPSNPDTPTEAPGTPNSTTTSLSALSTTAIKDGHRGTSFPHSGAGHHHTTSSNTLEAERADRISRLAGLERVSASRPQNPNAAAGSSTGASQLPGYFDQNGNPVYTTRMSTVGSASATGSTGGQTTTWASGSARAGDDEDQMSMDTNDRDMENDHYSASAVDEDMEGDGMSDDTSLVGFGEGAGSTVSGPIYNRRDVASSPAVGKTGLPSHLQNPNSASGPGTPGSSSTTATAEQQRRDARMIDGLADDTSGYVDTAARGGRGVPSRGSGTGAEVAEGIVKDRLDDGEGRKKAGLGTPDDPANLGKFYFEEKK